MKNIMYCLIVVGVCSCAKLKVVAEPVTQITTTPQRIDSSQYPLLKKTFNLVHIEAVSDYYGALSSNVKMVKGLSTTVQGGCLNRSGGRLNACNIIIVEEGDGYLPIASEEDFKAYFAPIDSEEKALSYVAVTTGTTPITQFNIPSRYRTYVKELHKSYAVKKDNGFVTLTYDYQKFGCGPHPYFAVTSFVGPNGNVKELERVKVYEDPDQDGICID